MPDARIHQRHKSSTQSGRRNADQWVLQFQSAAPKRADPLTGWAGSADTQEQVTLTFPTLEAAQAYAAKEGLTVTVIPPAPRTLKLQAYADNFR